MLFASGLQLRDELIAKLAAQGSLPLPFYPDLYKTDDPASGFLLTVYGARFSTGYFAARNRFTVLVETHSWKDYATRVRVTRNTIAGLVELIAEHGATWLTQAQHADAAGLEAAGNNFALDFAAGWREPTQPSSTAENTHDSPATMIDFRGYAYTRKPSAISGELVTVYDPRTPQIWHVPFRKNIAPSLVVNAPRRGYLIPAGYADEVQRKLALHGVAFQPFESRATTLDVEVFRATQATFSTSPFEGRMRTIVDGEWRMEARPISPNMLFVPIAQHRARLAMVLLEPKAPDSLAAWGFFNGCFEQKEHVEPYVAEQIAREMLSQEPELAAEFQLKLTTDSDFANNSAARLEFFLRRHSSWDEQFNLYPIYRL
jgi:hypothetical protein